MLGKGLADAEDRVDTERISDSEGGQVSEIVYFYCKRLIPRVAECSSGFEAGVANAKWLPPSLLVLRLLSSKWRLYPQNWDLAAERKEEEAEASLDGRRGAGRLERHPAGPRPRPPAAEFMSFPACRHWISYT